MLHLADVACSQAPLKPIRNGHLPDDLFDCPSDTEQATIATGGRIDLKPEWKPL